MINSHPDYSGPDIYAAWAYMEGSGDVARLWCVTVKDSGVVGF